MNAIQYLEELIAGQRISDIPVQRSELELLLKMLKDNMYLHSSTP